MYKSKCTCYNCSKIKQKDRKEKKKDKCPKSESCCEFKYLNNVLGKPGDIVEVIPSNDYSSASVQKIVCDKQLEWLWAEAAGGTMSDTGAAIDVDCNGNFYVTGTFEGTHACFGQFILTNGGSGFPSGNAFIAKLTPDCSWEWVKSASNVSYAGGTGISTDCNGNIYVTGLGFSLELRRIYVVVQLQAKMKVIMDLLLN